MQQKIGLFGTEKYHPTLLKKNASNEYETVQQKLPKNRLFSSGIVYLVISFQTHLSDRMSISATSSNDGKQTVVRSYASHEWQRIFSSNVSVCMLSLQGIIN